MCCNWERHPKETKIKGVMTRELIVWSPKIDVEEEVMIMHEFCDKE